MNENMEHNEIDHIFSEAFDKFETPYQETYWATMRENLDRNMPVKKTAPWKWLLPLLVVGLSAGGLLLWQSDSPTVPAVEEQIARQEDQPVTQTPAPVTQDNEAIQPPTVTNNSNVATDGHEKAKTILYTGAEAKKASRDNTRIANTLPALPSETEKALVDKTQKEQLAANTPPKQDDIKNEESTTDLNKSQEPGKNESPAFPSKQAETPNTTIVEKTEEPVKNTENKDVTDIKKTTGSNKVTKGNEGSANQVVAVANLDLHFLGGPSLGNAFSSDGGRQDKVVNYQAGLGFGYHFNKKLSLNIDLLYQVRNGHTLVRRVASDEYFLYKKSQTFTLTTSKSDYLVVPIYLKYNITGRHSVTGGLYTNFLLNSYNKTENATTSMWGSSSGVTEDKVNYGAWEVINYGWTVNYEYALLKNVGIGLGYSQGMKDATVNSFYKNSRNDLYKDLQFTLKYYWK